jgi:hypothetical protein
VHTVAEILSDSNDLLRDYAGNGPPEQNEDSIMRAVPQDRDELIALSVWWSPSADIDPSRR